MTSRGRMRPTSVRCWADWCRSSQASAVRAAKAATSTRLAGTISSGSRTASRMAGTASCGMRANEDIGTDAAPPRSMSVPASTATSPTASASASLTSSGRRGGSLVPRSMSFSQEADMPTNPASTGPCARAGSGFARPYASRRGHRASVNLGVVPSPTGSLCATTPGLPGKPYTAP